MEKNVKNVVSKSRRKSSKEPDVDAFQFWQGKYVDVGKLSNKKDRLGEKSIFVVTYISHSGEYGNFKIYSAVPKQWVSADLKNLLYPIINKELLSHTKYWNERIFNYNIWPQENWMEYDVDCVFNKDNLFSFLRASKKARALQDGTLVPDNWSDSEKQLGPDSSSPSKAMKKVSRQTSPQARPSNEKGVDNQLTTTKSSIINEIHPPLLDDNQKENNLIDEELPITLPPKKNAFNKKRNSSTSDESDPNEDDSSEIPSHHDSFENQDYSPKSASLHDSYENPSDNLDSSETEANDGVPPTNGESTSVNTLITKDPLIDDTSSLLQDHQIVLCDNLDLNGIVANRDIALNMVELRAVVESAEFLALNKRLDMTAYSNVLECAKTHRAVHSTWFEKKFPKLPCNTLQEIEAVNTVLGTISSSVHAVLYLANKFKSARVLNKFIKVIFRVFLSDALCDKIQWRAVVEGKKVKEVGLNGLHHNLMAVFVASAKIWNNSVQPTDPTAPYVGRFLKDLRKQMSAAYRLANNLDATLKKSNDIILEFILFFAS
uniref:Uncharacterized protein n=1 Tax=Daphnia galeata TaxID=27404 RepID=A0A8J2RU66_9CRUS|nr:unnamed protein product [Daphnia galeata]